jgi:hypothetical protein
MLMIDDHHNSGLTRELINEGPWGTFMCISEALFFTFVKYALWGRFIKMMVN